MNILCSKTVLTSILIALMGISQGMVLEGAHAAVDCKSVDAPFEDSDSDSVLDDLEDIGTQARRNVIQASERRAQELQTLVNREREINQETTRLQTELQRARDGDQASEVTRIQGEIATLNRERSENAEFQTQINDTNRSVNNSSIMRQARVEQEINRQIVSSIGQGERLTEALDECGDCENKSILQQRITANKQFTEFLRARLKYELCNNSEETHPCRSGNPTELQQLRTTMDEWTTCVRESVEAINKVEREREQGRTFVVSDIFTLRDPADGENRKSFFDVTNQIATWLITLVSSLAVTTLIIGGFLMIISGGDESRLETGKTIFTYSLIGIIVTLMAYGIIAFLQSIFYQ